MHRTAPDNGPKPAPGSPFLCSQVRTTADAPRNNWALLEQARRENHDGWLRSLTPEDGLRILSELHDLFIQATERTAEGEALCLARWQERLEIRLRMVAAFAILDRYLDDRHP